MFYFVNNEIYLVGRRDFIVFPSCSQDSGFVCIDTGISKLTPEISNPRILIRHSPTWDESDRSLLPLLSTLPTKDEILLRIVDEIVLTSNHIKNITRKRHGVENSYALQLELFASWCN